MSSVASLLRLREGAEEVGVLIVADGLVDGFVVVPSWKVAVTSEVSEVRKVAVEGSELAQGSAIMAGVEEVGSRNDKEKVFVFAAEESSIWSSLPPMQQ